MALIHEFEKTGNWLFKRRSWLPAFLVISGLAVMYFARSLNISYNTGDELIFLGISLFGQLIRILTVGFAPGNTSGRNTAGGQIADKINVTGIYSVIRHPLYAGNYFMWLGPALFMRSAWFAIVFTLVYWIYYERIMFAEEQYLRRKFGEAYDLWSENVRAILPSLRKYIPPALTFSLKTVLRREYNSFINIFVIFTILDLFRNFIITGGLSINPLYAWTGGTALLIWIILRTIHKTTSWFTVEGR
jgi:protein-S-isoprenylcysteine O-methyltransferase Ste14